MGEFVPELSSFIEKGLLSPDDDAETQELIRTRVSSLFQSSSVECEIERLVKKYLSALLALHPKPHFIIGDG
jgi:hypothetical protein